MDWGGPAFVIAIIAVSTAGWLINNWIRAKHGYPLEDELFGKTDKPASNGGEVKELREENAKLIELLEAQGKRMETLERIVTDKGYRLNEEIEALRDLPDKTTGSGVPLEISTKEKA